MADIQGMTVSERLLIMDELDEFELAIRDKNRELAIKILRQLTQSDLEAAKTVDQILSNPDKFGI